MRCCENVILKLPDGFALHYVLAVNKYHQSFVSDNQNLTLSFYSIFHLENRILHHSHIPTHQLNRIGHKVIAHFRQGGTLLGSCQETTEGHAQESNYTAISANIFY